MIMAMVETPKERTLTLKHRLRGNSKFKHLFCEAQYDNGCGRDTYREDPYAETGSVSAWHPSDPEFDPHFWNILCWRLGHEKISTAILPLLLIQEEQLSATGERMCTKCW